jgi:iron(III) transport system substrate-binding protein
MDPVPSTTGTMIIPKGIRHPHAALLLADFILSKEGQQILANAEYFPVRSDVPPKDVLASVIPERAGVPELFISSDQLNEETERSVKIFDKMFR